MLEICLMKGSYRTWQKYNNMNLYATVTGSKLVDGKFIQVKKGQGSNQQINIALSVDGTNNPRFRLFVNRRIDDSTDIVLVDTEKPYPKNVLTKVKVEKKRADN